MLGQVHQLGATGSGQGPPRRGGEVMMFPPPGDQHVTQPDVQQPGGRSGDLADGGGAGLRREVRQGAAQAPVGVRGHDGMA